MPVNVVRGTRSLDTIEAHIENLQKQLEKAETRKAEAVQRVALADRVIDDLKAEIDRYETEAEEKGADIQKRFERADAYAAKIIAKRNKPKAKKVVKTKAPEKLRNKMDSPEYIEGQRVASHRYWHASGRSKPKKTCSYCVEEGLITEETDKKKNGNDGKKGSYGMHTRWHTNRDVTKSDCIFCITEGRNK